jgi:hypothetical protein
VHEAWADGSSWSKVIPILQNKGFNETAVQLSPLGHEHGFDQIKENVYNNGNALRLPRGKHPSTVFLRLRTGGQKGLRCESRKRMNPLTQNFRFSWFVGYTF